MRYAITRECPNCGWRDTNDVEQEPFQPKPDPAELEQAEWECANCGPYAGYSVTLAELPPRWADAFTPGGMKLQMRGNRRTRGHG